MSKIRSGRSIRSAVWGFAFLGLGLAGYAAVQQDHDAALLPERLLRVYGTIARQARRHRVVSLLKSHASRFGLGDGTAPASALDEAPAG